MPLSAAELERGLSLYLLLLARVLPVFVLLPWLAFRNRAWLLALALALAFAAACWPLARAGGAATVPGVSALALLAELVRGSVIALGSALPFVVLTIAAGLVDGLRGVAAVGGSALARASGLAALVSAVSLAFFAGCARLLFEPARALGDELTDWTGLRALLRELAQLCVRALELGVSFSAPILLGVLCAAIVLGLVGRVAGNLIVQSAGTGLLPYLGLALLCLVTANWLGAVPQLVRTFAVQTARLLSALH